jgi:hypothetical protein
MNVIFLDIDGVLRTDKSDRFWSKVLNQDIPTSIFDRKLSPTSIKILNEIILITDAKVVITSMWRTVYDLDKLKSIFKDSGFKGEIVGETNQFGYRGEEIQEWLDTNYINKYVVVDDSVRDILNHIDAKRVIKIDPINGLDDTYFDSIVDLIL